MIYVGTHIGTQGLSEELLAKMTTTTKLQWIQADELLGTIFQRPGQASPVGPTFFKTEPQKLEGA